MNNLIFLLFIFLKIALNSNEREETTPSIAEGNLTKQNEHENLVTEGLISTTKPETTPQSDNVTTESTLQPDNVTTETSSKTPNRFTPNSFYNPRSSRLNVNEVYNCPINKETPINQSIFNAISLLQRNDLEQVFNRKIPETNITTELASQNYVEIFFIAQELWLFNKQKETIFLKEVINNLNKNGKFSDSQTKCEKLFVNIKENMLIVSKNIKTDIAVCGYRSKNIIKSYITTGCSKFLDELKIELNRLFDEIYTKTLKEIECVESNIKRFLNFTENTTDEEINLETKRIQGEFNEYIRTKPFCSKCLDLFEKPNPIKKNHAIREVDQLNELLNKGPFGSRKKSF